MKKSIEVLKNAIDAGKRHKEFLEEEVQTFEKNAVVAHEKLDKINIEIKEIEQAIKVLEKE